MTKSFWITALSVVAVIVLAAFIFSRLYKVSAKTPSVNPSRPIDYLLHFPTTAIGLEVATSSADQTLGLSFRSSLPINNGMLFVFPFPWTYQFWMKDMHFALDMIWLDHNLQVVTITKDATPNSYPKTFSPAKPAQYVIEVNAGVADTYGVKVGQTLTIEKLTNVLPAQN